MNELVENCIVGFYSFKNFVDLNDMESEMVWKWRNDLAVRKWMYNSDPISYESHLNFLENLKSIKSKNYWLVQRNNIAIGVHSLVNIEANQGEWGYYIAPEFHEKNLSVEFYYYSLKELFENVKIVKIYGYANIQNVAANSLNNLFGFSKLLIDKEVNGKIEKYVFRELSSETWSNKIANEKRIKRLLEFTQKSY